MAKSTAESSPPLVSGLSLRNFRGFGAVRRIPLRPLTFLVGPNSSGKSSIGAAIMFLAQSGFIGLGGIEPIWSGRLIELGSYDDVVYRHSRKRRLEISIQLSNLPLFRQKNKINDITLSVEMCAGAEPAGVVSRIDLTAPGNEDVAVIRRPGRYASYDLMVGKSKRHWKQEPSPYRPGFSYHIFSTLHEIASARRSKESAQNIQALQSMLISMGEFGLMTQRVPSGRLPPQRWYSRTSSPGERDPEGDSLSDRVDPIHLRVRKAANRTSPTRLLKKIGICANVTTKDFSPYHTAINVSDMVTGVESNLIDVGFGISQVFPVVRSLLARGTGPLYLEQPEVHLHPRAQSELGEVIALASRKRQVLVETHSEHLINRARILMAKGDISAKDATIIYVDRNQQGSTVTVIGFDERGNFTKPWPHGFFDERYNDAMTLAKVQSELGDE